MEVTPAIFPPELLYCRFTCMKSACAAFRKRKPGYSDMKNTKYFSYLLAIASSLFLCACFNMPTSSSQITGSYISPLKYKDFSCEDMNHEATSLARRENMLVIAQEQRMKSSQAQAFWFGYGQGDGMEAAELANVRGEKEALISMMNRKGCTVPANFAKPFVIEQPEQAGSTVE